MRTTDLLIEKPSEIDFVKRMLGVEKRLQELFQSQKCVIASAGNIGLGKTVIMELLEGRTGLTCYYENPDQNELLKIFYEDKPRYSFPLQMRFIELRSQQIEEAHRIIQSAGIDRSIYEDLLIFSKAMVKRQEMRQEDFAKYSDEFEKRIRELPTPNLIIFVTGSTDFGLEQIARRGREYEIQTGKPHSGIPRDYYDALNQEYLAFTQNLTNSGWFDKDVLRIDRENIDFVNNPAHYVCVLEGIEQLLKQKL